MSSEFRWTEGRQKWFINVQVDEGKNFRKITELLKDRFVNMEKKEGKALNEKWSIVV